MHSERSALEAATSEVLEITDKMAEIRGFAKRDHSPERSLREDVMTDMEDRSAKGRDQTRRLKGDSRRGEKEKLSLDYLPT